MNNHLNHLLVLGLLVLTSNIAAMADATVTGNAEAGRQFWVAKTVVKGDSRSCATCHTPDPRNTGKHVRTGKPIDPMSPSANPVSLTDPKKVKKWFLRNCKWTLGRECSAQEKSDVLSFLKSN